MEDKENSRELSEIASKISLQKELDRTASHQSLRPAANIRAQAGSTLGRISKTSEARHRTSAQGFHKSGDAVRSSYSQSRCSKSRLTRTQDPQQERYMKEIQKVQDEFDRLMAEQRFMMCPIRRGNGSALSSCSRASGLSRGRSCRSSMDVMSPKDQVTAPVPVVPPKVEFKREVVEGDKEIVTNTIGLIDRNQTLQLLAAQRNDGGKPD